MRQEAKTHRTIPIGWTREKLGNLADKITKGATPTTYGYEFQQSGINFIKIQNVFTGTIDLTTITDFISEEAHQNQKKSILKIDDVLFSIAGTIGETSIVNPQHLPANTNQAFAIISGFSELLLPKYLEFQLRSFVSQKTKEKARGGAMNNVSLEDLKHLELLLPPLPEQHRIVAKIEELFSELDKGIENLKTARAQIKVYRQALLKHAFEGKLTREWRAENRDKLETAAALLRRIQQERAQRYQQQLADWETSGSSKPKAPKPLPPLTAEELAELPELPEGWLGARLGWMTCSVEYGTSAKSSESGACPVLRMGNIQNGKFDWTDLVFTDDENEIAKYLLQEGDVLFNRTNSPELVGKSAIFKSKQPGIFAGYLIRVNQIATIVESQYLNYFLNSHIAKQHGNTVKTDGVNQSNINGDKLVNYPFPFCSLEEQKVIVELLDARLSEVDQLELTITTSLQQAEALRQSILKKAFSGQLVPQDPHDEPASALLARIRAERVASKATAKPSRVKIRL